MTTDTKFNIYMCSLRVKLGWVGHTHGKSSSLWPYKVQVGCIGWWTIKAEAGQMDQLTNHESRAQVRWARQGMLERFPARLHWLHVRWIGWPIIKAELGWDGTHCRKVFPKSDGSGDWSSMRVLAQVWCSLREGTLGWEGLSSCLPRSIWNIVISLSEISYWLQKANPIKSKPIIGLSSKLYMPHKHYWELLFMNELVYFGRNIFLIKAKQLTKPMLSSFVIFHAINLSIIYLQKNLVIWFQFWIMGAWWDT